MDVFVHADGAIMDCVAGLLRGVSPAEPVSAAREPVTSSVNGLGRRRVMVHLQTISGSRRGLPRVPHFRRATGAGLCDSSEGWEAEIVETDEICCNFGLVDVEAFGATVAPTLRRLNVAAALRVSLGLAAPMVDGLLLHAAGLVSDGGALVFLGASGQGKSTMESRLAGWSLLADDAVLVWREAGRWHATGTMLPGKERAPRMVGRVPLAGLVMLEKGAVELELEPLSAAAALASVMPRVLFHADPDERVLSLALGLAAETPAYVLRSGLEHEVASMLRELVVRADDPRAEG